MKNLLIAIVICILVIFSSQSLAAAGRPAWSLLSETAYNLKPAQWNVNLGSWVNYGLNDKFQMGTNCILDILSIPNFYAKYVLLDEAANNLQVSLGGSLYYPLATNTPISTDLAVNLSKALDDGNYIVHAGMKQTTNINDTGIATSNPINTPGLGFKAGVITNQSDLSHLFVEAYSNWIPMGHSSEFAIGGDFVSENRTVSFGGIFYSSDSSDRRASLLPFANVQWVF